MGRSMGKMMMAAAGFGAGIWFGKHQLTRWKLWNKKTAGIFAGGLAASLLAGGYLMVQYEYHILKILRYQVLLYGLLLLALLDGKEKRIPNRALGAMFGFRTLLLVTECVCFPEYCLEIVLSAAGGMAGGVLLFGLAGVLTRKGIGMGDIKLIGVMGFYLGFSVLMSDLVVTMTLTILGGMAALIFGKASLRTEIAFAPFVAAGTFITVLMGF